MKLQVAFDITDIEKALHTADTIAKYVDIFEIGTILLYAQGVCAITRFKDRYPDQSILADAKIVDRGHETAKLLANFGADWITVISGAHTNVIHAVCATAHEFGKKVMLDLLGAANTVGQSALEAKGLGIDAILFHDIGQQTDTTAILDTWELVKSNSALPLFFAGPVTRTTVPDIIALKPDGIVLSSSLFEGPAGEQEVCAIATMIHDSAQ